MDASKANGDEPQRADDEPARLRRALDEGRKAALLALLPVFDTLERALEVGSTDSEFFSGVEATGRMFLEALHRAGAQPVETVGHPFDPRHHETAEPWR